jgi:superoxide dismutase, Cu-Zn family
MIVPEREMNKLEQNLFISCCKGLYPFLAGSVLLASGLQAATLKQTIIPETGERIVEIQVKKAVAALNPTKGSHAAGMVYFTDVEEGVQIVADVEGLSPGKHGFHIHEYGDCSSPDAASAGGHFNPTYKKHGGPDSAERHVGDLGNLVADERGVAHYDRIDSVISLNGSYSIVGKALVVHANADDFKTQPKGNSGGGVTCGIISEK